LTANEDGAGLRHGGSWSQQNNYKAAMHLTPRSDEGAADDIQAISSGKWPDKMLCQYFVLIY
jgi:hypothetical protein